jgi:hypothetical protein
MYNVRVLIMSTSAVYAGAVVPAGAWTGGFGTYSTAGSVSHRSDPHTVSSMQDSTPSPYSLGQQLPSLSRNLSDIPPWANGISHRFVPTGALPLPELHVRNDPVTSLPSLPCNSPVCVNIAS